MRSHVARSSGTTSDPSTTHTHGVNRSPRRNRYHTDGELVGQLLLRCLSRCQRFKSLRLLRKTSVVLNCILQSCLATGGVPDTTVRFVLTIAARLIAGSFTVSCTVNLRVQNVTCNGLDIRRVYTTAAVLSIVIDPLAEPLAPTPSSLHGRRDFLRAAP